MYRIVIYLICFVLVTGCLLNPEGKVQPAVKSGVLDLRQWRFQTDGTVSLDGEWEFYWERFLEPGDFIDGSLASEKQYITVPGNWNGQTVAGKILEGHGFATYRLLVKVNPDEKLYALKALEAANAYKLWINGRLLAENGVVGNSREKMQPQHTPGLVIFEAETDRIELLFQVSNYVHNKGGLWNPYILGTASQIVKIREENLFIEFVLFGSIVIMGLYHLGLFLLRTRDRSPLYFGLFCLLIALRTVLVGERILHVYAPWIGWGLLLRLEYLTFYLSAPVFLIFLGTLFSRYSQIPIRFAVLISSLFSITVLVADTTVFTKTLGYYQVFILICCLYALFNTARAIKDGIEGAILICSGSVFLFVTLVYDILLAQEIIFGINLSPFGLFTFIFIQSIMLSIRFSKAFSMAEELSEELEAKVEQRTKGLRQANIEISRSSKKLQETQAQLIQSQKMEAMGTLAGGIAHDFNNILGTILGYTELLKNDLPPASTEREYSEAIFQSGERAAELVQQILTFSRADQLELVPIQIQKPIQGILNLMRGTLPETVEVKEEIDPDCSPVMANQTQITQIVMNLCTNSAHAMKGKKGILEIRLQEADIRKGQYCEKPAAEGGYAQLTVKDNGIGMVRKVQDRVFDPYFTTKDVNEGSGLGLSIVHGIVESHNGFVRLESEPGLGSTFEVFIPVTDQNVVEIEEGLTEAKKGKGNLLIVEDDRDLASFYEITFNRLGYNTEVFYSGKTALDCFKSQPEAFDLIFSDQVMPDMTGIELSREILRSHPHIPIILATGYNDSISKDEAQQIGIACLLMKPIRINRLAQKIWELT